MIWPNKEISLVETLAGKNLLLKQGARRKMVALRTELAGPAPTPLERLLVDRVVLCWQQLHYADVVFTQNMAELSIRQAEYHQRRISHCHRRYLSAIRALALVRRLLRPTVAQVNIAEQQVNMAPVTLSPGRAPGA